MSLKAFHIVFITLSSGLALGCGVWLLVSGLSAAGMKKDVFFGVSSLLGAVALIFYGRYFLKKLKNVSYL
jgi:membrane protein implicated in regulation of membrane protease activity